MLAKWQKRDFCLGGVQNRSHFKCGIRNWGYPKRRGIWTKIKQNGGIGFLNKANGGIGSYFCVGRYKEYATLNKQNGGIGYRERFPCKERLE